MHRIKIAFTTPNGFNIKDTIAWHCYETLNIPDLGYVVSSGCNIAHVRNYSVNEQDCCKLFQKNFNFDYLLSIDCDIEYTQDDVEKIIGYNLPVCGGSYKVDKKNYAAGPWNSLPGNCSYATGTIHGLQKVDWTGAGFMCIRRDVFERVAYPWFEGVLIETADAAVETSEEIGLMYKLRRYDIPVYCDFDIKLKHHKSGCE